MATRLKCELISWRRVHELSRSLAGRIRAAGYRPDIVVAIGRGGYVPARLIADYLNLMDLTSMKIEHYTMGARRQPVARVRYPLCVDVSGKRVLIIDDVSDTGDTFCVAIDHVKQKYTPAGIMTGVLHHKQVSRYEPDFYGQKIIKWRWIIYPWALLEDVSGFIQQMETPPHRPEALAERIHSEYGIRVSPETVEDALSILEENR